MAKAIASTTQVRTDEGGFAEQRKISASSRGGKLPAFGDRTRMFYLGVHPASWDLVQTAEGWRLVPVMKRLIVHPGVWTKTPPKGQAADPSFMLAKHKRAGFKTLEDHIDDYLYDVDGADGAKGIFLTWEKVRLYEDGAFEVVIDADARTAYALGLVASKVVPPPREGVISEMRNRFRKHVQRATRTPHLAMAQEAKADAEKRLAGIEEALAFLKAKPSAAKADA